MDLEFIRREDLQLLICKVLYHRLDGSVTDTFGAQFEQNLSGSIRNVAVDISSVGFLDSTGLGALISLRKRLPQDGGFAICGATEQVSTLFRLARVNKILPLCDSIDEAIASFTKKGTEQPPGPV